MPSDPPSGSNNAFDRDNLFLEHLRRGFGYLRAGAEQDGNFDDITYENGLPKVLSKVTVHFMDPTAAASSVILTKKLHAENSSLDGTASLDLYQRIATILERDYQNTLSDVPYQHNRTGKTATIPRLFLQPTVSYGGILMVDSEEESSEWHMNPLCHVYLAACHSLEHYRTQVKPSIQIFVSQLQAAVRPSTSSQPQQTPQYMIVVVPTGGDAADAATASSSSSSSNHNTTPATTPEPKSRVSTFASRMAAARQRMGMTTTTTTTSSASDAVAADSSAAMSDDEMDVGYRKSKLERELVRRLTADFTSARVVALPSLQSKHEAPALYEWESFLTGLSATIVGSFQEKCRYYEEELKTVAAQRLITTSPVDDRQYYLLKESLAFTFEQCRLHSETLLQYKELRALMPDMDRKYFDKGSGGGASGINTNTVSLALQTALHGDALAFRQHVRMASSLAAIGYELEHYLLVRETTQLFAMQHAGPVLERCLAFVKMMWQVKEHLAGGNRQRLVQANKWALEFGWVVQEAVALYPNHNDRPFAVALCELVSFTRLRLQRLGKLLGMPVSMNLGGQQFPDDLRIRQAWQPYQSDQPSATTEDPEEASLVNTSDVVAQALSTKEGFEWMYMSLTKLLAANQEACGRKKIASCLRLEAIDIAIRQNRLRSATVELKKVARECGPWRNCHFFLLFRLCQLQRQFDSPAKYLETLVQCFAAPDAPAAARQVLFDDLTAVCQTVDAEITAPDVFQPLLALEQPWEGAASLQQKKVYTIGEAIPIKISIFSQLPKAILVDSVTLAVVPFKAYIAAMEDNTEIKPSDTFQELELKQVEIQPGSNELRYEWVPIHSGQFILSSVAILWKQACFSYNAKERKRPTIRVDVIPCEHSQSLSMVPNYLLPGHTQNVTVEYRTGRDSVDQGKLQIVGSPGVLVGKADDTASSTLELDLESFAKDSTFRLPLRVQCAASASNATLTLQANTHFSREGGEAFEAQIDATVPVLAQRAFSVQALDMTAYQSDRLLIHAELQCHAPVANWILQSWQLQVPDYLDVAAAADDLNQSLTNARLGPDETIRLAFDCRIDQPVPDMIKATLVLTVDNGAGTVWDDAYVLVQPRPSIPPPRAAVPAVPVQISLSATHGPVGVPIHVTCRVGDNDNKLRYVLQEHHHDDWIISGQTQGPVPANAEIRFVAIPIRPSSAAHLPAVLSLRRDDEQEVPVTLTTNTTTPTIFASKDPVPHASVAIPLSDDAADCRVM